jgi:GNAT superfamily N-acetyltransferase
LGDGVAAGGMSETSLSGRWWYARLAASTDAPPRLISVQSDRHPDGAVVELDPQTFAEQAGHDVACVVDFGDEDLVTGLHVADRLVARCPPLWFHEVRETAFAPVAVNLVVFTGNGQASGALLDASALESVPVGSGDQLAALRWYPGSGEVDQVYVQPQWRRHGLAGVLLIAAGALSVARGWNRLWGDGQRTELGEALRNNSPWRGRAADLTHLAPPMTPGEQS